MATLREVARKAGVSLGTVDRVVHGRGRVSEATREKIQRILDSSGYKANIFARNLSLGKPRCFAVVMPKRDQDCGYWELAARGIDRAAQDLACYDIAVRFFFFDRFRPASYRSVLSAVQAAKPDGLLMAPVLKEFCENILDAIKPSVPYCFFDSDLPGTTPLSVIHQDPFQSGVLAGRLFEMIVREPGTVAAINAYREDGHVAARAKGFAARLTASASLSPVIHEVAGAPGVQSFDRLLSYLTDAHDDLRAILVTSAWTHAAAVWMKSHTRKPRLHLIGYDAVEASIPYIKDGTIDFLLSQRPELQGFEGIHALYRHCVLGESGPGRIAMPIDIMTRENIPSTTYWGERKGVSHGEVVRHRC